MNKYIVCFIVFTIIFFSFNVYAINEKEPTKVFMGLRMGEVASIDLENWEATYYPTRISRTWFTYDTKYFPNLNKVIFGAGEADYHIGVIDVITGEVIYPWPDIEGLGNKMIGYSLNILEHDVIYLDFADKGWAYVSEEEVEEFRETIKLVRYNMREDIWKQVDIHGWENINQYLFDRIPSGPRDRAYKKNDLLIKLIDQGILGQDASTWDIIDGVYINQNYFLCKKDDRIILVETDGENFTVVKESPEEFGQDDWRLLNPDSVTFIFETRE